MAIPGIPQQIILQQGNSQVFISWDLVAGATSYTVQRSTDQITYSTVGSPLVTNYLDTTVTVGVEYFYQVASVNSSGTSSYGYPASGTTQSVIPTLSADLSLGQARYMAQQKADRVGSNFVTLPEWNTYLNQSYFELYDLLITLYEDYYVQDPYEFTTDGTTAQYPLPDDFYKLLGVDCGIGSGVNGFVTLHKFDFIQRNRYIYPNVSGSFLGVFNLRYRLVGNTLMFIPTPNGNQVIRMWYIPKLVQLLKDTDIMTGISGWTEYVLVDAAIKALMKEESDVQGLMLQKQMLLKRIEDSAMNRDAGQPDTISDTRTRSGIWGEAGQDGNFGGY